MKKLALILVVLFAFAAVGVAAEKKAAGADKPADKAADTKGDAQAELVFSDAAFAKAFEIKK